LFKRVYTSDPLRLSSQALATFDNQLPAGVPFTIEPACANRALRHEHAFTAAECPPGRSGFTMSKLAGQPALTMVAHAYPNALTRVASRTR